MVSICYLFAFSIHSCKRLEIISIYKFIKHISLLLNKYFYYILIIRYHEVLDVTKIYSQSCNYKLKCILIYYEIS